MNSLKENANYVVQTDSLEDMMEKPGGISDYDVCGMAETKKRAENALQKIKQLLDAKTPDSEPIKLEKYDNDARRAFRTNSANSSRCFDGRFDERALSSRNGFERVARRFERRQRN